MVGLNGSVPRGHWEVRNCHLEGGIVVVASTVGYYSIQHGLLHMATVMVKFDTTLPVVGIGYILAIRLHDAAYESTWDCTHHGVHPWMPSRQRPTLKRVSGWVIYPEIFGLDGPWENGAATVAERTDVQDPRADHELQLMTPQDILRAMEVGHVEMTGAASQKQQSDSVIGGVVSRIWIRDRHGVTPCLL